jgi:hypothetical protein
MGQAIDSDCHFRWEAADQQEKSPKCKCNDEASYTDADFALIDAANPVPAVRGPYKKTAEISN